MTRRWAWRRPFDYVVAATAVSLAAVLNIVIFYRFAPETSPQISPLFFAAVMVSAWFGGLGPGLFATGYAAFLSIYLFTHPFGSFQIGLPDVVRLSVFLSVALLTSWLTARREQAEQALRQAHAELEDRVRKRTAELQELNETLRREIVFRKQAEQGLLEHQHQLSELASQLSLAEERERRRIATLLHDDVGQVLSLTQMRLEQARDALDAGGSPTAAAASLAGVAEVLEQAIGRARNLTSELSPPILYELGFEAAIEWLVDRMRQRTTMDMSFEADAAPKTLGEQRSIVLFQVVREILTNCIKHSKGTRVDVRVSRRGAEVCVDVEDDGIGFDASPGGTARTNSFGLFNIRERLSHEGGWLEIDAGVGRGSRLLVLMPIQENDR